MVTGFEEQILRAIPAEEWFTERRNCTWDCVQTASILVTGSHHKSVTFEFGEIALDRTCLGFSQLGLEIADKTGTGHTKHINTLFTSKACQSIPMYANPLV